MKKLSILLVMTVMLSVFTGCKKDEPVDLSKSIAGTTWSFEMSELGISISDSYNFKDASTVVETVGYAGQTASLSGTYEYTYPNVDVTIQGETTSFTMSSDYKTMTDESGYVYTKK